MLRRSSSLLLAFFAFAAPAFAGDIGVALGFRAGTLGVRVHPVSLGGSVQVPVTVVDARGSGAGWQLRLSGRGAPAVTSIAARCGANSTCTLPKATLGWAGGTTTFKVAPHSGMGVIELVATVSGGHGPLSAAVR